MSQWGRKVYPSWPSRHPVWTISAFFGGGAVLHAHACRAVSAELGSFVERFYLPVYAPAERGGSRDGSGVRSAAPISTPCVRSAR